MSTSRRWQSELVFEHALSVTRDDTFAAHFTLQTERVDEPSAVFPVVLKLLLVP